MSNLTESNGTKRGRIRSLLAEGGHDVKSIARLANTTENNVYKEAHLYRKDGGKFAIERSSKTSVVTTQSGSGQSRELSKTETVRLEPMRNDHLAVPDLDQKDLKELYIRFRHGSTPSQIISELGLHPEAVEKEYLRHLQMSNQDRDKLIHLLFFEIVTGRTEKIEDLKRLYESRRTLSNDQIISILRDQNRCQYYFGVNTLLNDIGKPYNDLPLGWARPSCKRCRQPVPDVIYAVNSYAQSAIRNIYFECEKCRAR
jgi:hypothetical protein